ncbi:MAG TPA: hypothetical protein VLQ45_20665 [Thermoanaerobaculia bacterium]|nr:hypothetical protein [Thermoanaerobaculia bacterium]
MKRLIPIFALIIALAPAALATQGRGGGGPGPGQRAASPPSGDRAPQRQRIHMDSTQQDQQRQRVRDCELAADQVRSQARTMARDARRGFDPAQAVRERDQLHRNVETMLQRHEQVLQGLTAPQRDRLRDRIRPLDQSRDRLRICLRELDEELAQPDPDDNRFRGRVRDVENAARDWQAHYRELARSMGLR